MQIYVSACWRDVTTNSEPDTKRFAVDWSAPVTKPLIPFSANSNVLTIVAAVRRIIAGWSPHFLQPSFARTRRSSTD